MKNLAHVLLKIGAVSACVMTAWSQDLRLIEYFIDVDPGFGNAAQVEIAPGQEVFQLETSVDVSALSPGAHTIYARALNSDGDWGHTESIPFHVKEYLPEEDDAILEEIEVFVGDDPGLGNGVKLPTQRDSESISIETLLNIGTDSVGSQLVGVRAKDSFGRWGHTAFMPYRVLIEYLISHVDYRLVQDGTEIGSGSIPINAADRGEVETLISDLSAAVPGPLEISAVAFTADGIGAPELSQSIQLVDQPLFFGVSGSIGLEGADGGPVIVRILKDGVRVRETQLSAEGSFSLEQLEAGAGYEILAFEDLNRNGKADSTEASLSTPLGSLGLFGDISALSLALESGEPEAATQTHPADTNGDFVISINEVTAYGAAWKSGNPWSIGPSPIPIDFVTRAGALWKHGSAYELDTDITGPPLWWVNLHAVERAATSVRQGEPSGRSIGQNSLLIPTPDPIVLKAMEGRIIADITPPIYTGTWALEIALSGESEARREGPFFGDGTRRFEWDAVEPNSKVSLVVSFDGISFDANLGEEGNKPHLQPELNDGVFSISARGITGSFRIEVSKDLKTWTPIGTTELNNGRLRLGEAVHQKEFYRISNQTNEERR